MLTDCLPLDVSTWTVKSTDSTSFETDVAMTCETGYRFDAQEYFQLTSVTLHCNAGGTWSYNGVTNIRIPSCESKYSTGFSQALEIMENLENHFKKFHAWKSHGI